MKRRSFCLNALAAGLASALPTASTLAALRAASVIHTDLEAVNSSGQPMVIEKAAAMELRESLEGALLAPNDAGYDTARKVWNGMIDKHPALIAVCRTDQDVANAVAFAADRQLLVAVRGGGHSFPGKSTCDKGLMIDLSAMHTVIVDAEARTARAQGGALLGQLDGAALAHNMITTTGVVSHTGIGGFSTGGGMGRTDRAHGLSVDNVLAARMVNADGQVRTVSADENADLYWAIRGGGGNFGVVTEFVYRLHPFNPTLYGGSLLYTWDQARDVLMHWAEVGESLPDEANVEPQCYIHPERKERVMDVQLYYAGPHDDGEKVFAPFARVGKPFANTLGLQSYQAVQTSLDGLTAHGQLNYLKSGLLPVISQGAIDAIVDSFEGDHLPETWFQHLGGATARVDPQATAFAHRHVHSNYGISSTWTDPALTEARIAKIREIYEAVQPHMQGFYTNLHEDTDRKTHSNYGVNYDRLVEIKTRHDPTNLFRLNANIEPKSMG